MTPHPLESGNEGCNPWSHGAFPGHWELLKIPPRVDFLPLSDSLAGDIY